MIEIAKKYYRQVRAAANRISFKFRYAVANDTVEMPYEKAIKYLDTISPRPLSTAIVQHQRFDEQFDLVIIVPAYCAEQWICECIDSILGQKTDFHYLIVVVDDGSTDRTGTILDGYLYNKNVLVIHQNNRGYSGARNVGLKHLFSRYIMFVDSDDYLLPGAIQLLLEKALNEEQDIVEGDGFTFDETGRLGKIKTNKSTYWGGPWLKVMRTTLFEKIEFPEGYLYEDKIIGSLILPSADKFATIPEEIYAYRIHGKSITQIHDTNPKRIDSLWIMLLMEDSRRTLQLPQDKDSYAEAIRQIIFTYKRTILLNDEIKKAIFAVSADFIKRNYKQFILLNPAFKTIETALLKNNFGKYIVCCEYGIYF